MGPQNTAKQIIAFNKTAFDNSFDAITILQNHSEKMLGFFLENASLFPQEGKKAIAEWLETFKERRKQFKSSADENFKSVEDFFAGAGQEMNFPFEDILKQACTCWQKATEKAADNNKNKGVTGSPSTPEKISSEKSKPAGHKRKATKTIKK